MHRSELVCSGFSLAKLNFLSIFWFFAPMKKVVKFRGPKCIRGVFDANINDKVIKPYIIVIVGTRRIFWHKKNYRRFNTGWARGQKVTAKGQRSKFRGAKLHHAMLARQIIIIERNYCQYLASYMCQFLGTCGKPWVISLWSVTLTGQHKIDKNCHIWIFQNHWLQIRYYSTEYIHMR